MESHTHTHDTTVHSMAVCPQQSFSECWKRGDLRRVSMEINRYLWVPRQGTKEHKEGKGNFPVPGCLPAWWLLPAGCSDFPSPVLSYCPQQSSWSSQNEPFHFLFLLHLFLLKLNAPQSCHASERKWGNKELLFFSLIQQIYYMCLLDEM